MKYLFDYTPEEIRKIFSTGDLPKYRVQQIIDGLYKSKALDLDAVSTLPKEIKASLKDGYTFFSVKLCEEKRSLTSDTRKFLFQLEDNEYIETVVIPNAKGQYTLCISSQVGCPLHCAFCASGLKGFVRDLYTHEIVEQVVYIKKRGIPVTNLVLMGTGEPFLNFDQVIKAVRIINDPELSPIGARKITVSTAGIIEGIEKLAAVDLQIRLSFSLHFPDEELRKKYMPVARKYSLAEIMNAVRKYQLMTRRIFTIEYILFKDINDSVAYAEKLLKLLKDLDCKINLIPYNPVPGLKFSPPEEPVIKAFYNYLASRDSKVTLRKRMGEDIDAACGQLRLRRMK